MDIKEVKDLIRTILQSDIGEFELEHTGTRLKLKRGFDADSDSVPTQVPPRERAKPATVPVKVEMAGATALPEEPHEVQEQKLHFITSPIVGTFYRAPSPGAEPYISVGSKVQEGTVLCVIEAMKLMNEIPCDVAGEVAGIYVENGHPVEFGQRLFGIKKQ
jgi:acetyl-CoA carboxylase biotin carboxyl carrier protein